MMRRAWSSGLYRLAWAVLALLACMATSPPAQANEPMMSVYSLAGDSTVYSVSQIQRIVFAGDTLKVAAYGRLDHYRLEQISRIEFLWWDSGNVDESRHPAGIMQNLSLAGNRPNPFKLVTRIGFNLPQAGPVQLVIYSVTGRLVRTLVKDTLQPGPHTAIWNGLNDSGVKVGSGIYFYRLLASGVDDSRRMILLP
jgi:hypothetical protein